MSRIIIASLVAFILMSFSAAQAATSALDQIKVALGKGDLIEVQKLVSQNPDLGGQAEMDVLSKAANGVNNTPQQTAQLMTLAANMSSYVSPDMSGKVSDAVKQVVDKTIKLKPENPEQVDTYVSILNSALTMAKAKNISGQNPDLAPWAEAKLETYSDDNDILLAQLPNGGYYPQGVGTRFIPFDLNAVRSSTPPPSRSSGSPS